MVVRDGSQPELQFSPRLKDNSIKKMSSVTKLKSLFDLKKCIINKSKPSFLSPVSLGLEDVPQLRRDSATKRECERVCFFSQGKEIEGRKRES